MSLSYIRSLLITDPIIILATIVMGSISLLTSLFDSDGRIQHQISRVWSRMLLKVSGVKMKVQGLEKIDPDATYVFVANHRSFMILREHGMSVMLFPEGGRSKDGILQDFIEGAAYIAVKAGVPVIPLAMTGTREVLPMGSLQIMSGIVELRIGDPIPTANLTMKDRATLTQTMHDRVADLLRSASQPQGAR